MISLMEQGRAECWLPKRCTPNPGVAGRYKIGPINNSPDGMVTVLNYLVE